MNALVYVLGIMYVVVEFVAVDGAALAVNSCTDCHKKAETLSFMRPWQTDSYFSWKSSIHGQRGVTCEKCHGGDPAQDKKGQAHRGVLNSSQPDSTIYYKKVPQTCGSCHQAIYESFTKSRHYQSLKDDRMSPTCTTCHGFHMAIGAANLYELATKCAICHNERSKVYPNVPAEVSEVLDIARKIEEILVKTESLMEVAKEKRQEIQSIEGRLQGARAQWDRVSPLWHTFDLKNFKKEAEGALKAANEVYVQSKGILLGK